VDLQLYFRVLWRFRLIMALGIILACVLSFLSYARISFKNGSPQVTYRQSETYQANSLLFLTQPGFPYGYTVLPLNPTKVGTGSAELVPRYADVGRFAGLAAYYAPFVRSDQYVTMLRHRTQVRGVVNAVSFIDPVSHASQPFITLSGFAKNAEDAVALSNVGSRTLIDYVKRQQDANNIPKSQRVAVQILSQAGGANISTARKTTTPIVVFLTVLLAAIGLSFVLENLRPRVRSVATLEEERPVAARRPA